MPKVQKWTRVEPKGIKMNNRFDCLKNDEDDDQECSTCIGDINAVQQTVPQHVVKRSYSQVAKQATKVTKDIKENREEFE